MLIRINSLTLDRGTNPEVGEIGRARTLDIQRAQDVQLSNLTLYGHGRGTALSLVDVEQGSVDNVVIRDMGWRIATTRTIHKTFTLEEVFETVDSSNSLHFTYHTNEEYLHDLVSIHQKDIKMNELLRTLSARC